MPKKLTQEEAMFRAIEIHSGKYDLSEMVYTGKMGLVKIKCEKHGWFDIIYRDFTKTHARGCQKCGWEEYLERKVCWNTISKEDAHQRLSIKYDGIYTFDMSTYKSFSQPMSVFCPTHGIFHNTPSDMYNMNKGCPSCGKLLSSVKRTKDMQTRKDEAILRFGDKYDYSLIPPLVSNKTEFEIICNNHNHKFSTTWNRHLSKGSLGGCPVCYKELMRKTHLQDTEDFISISKSAHGDRYGYSRSLYIDHKTPVEIECYEHGFFWQRADKHKMGHGCNKCVKNGFRDNKPAHLYVLEDGLRVKVGITNRKVLTRLSEINIGGGNFKLVKKYHYDVGQSCRDHETELLQYMRILYKNTEGKFDGVTESFEDVDVSLVLDFIENKRDNYD